MKAAVYDAYGAPDVLRIVDVGVPVPRDDEVLVRVHAATVGIVDSLARRGTPAYARAQFGLRRPRFPILGSNFAGEVESVGTSVTQLAAGDKVFGTMAPRFGAHVQYVCLSERAAVAPMPVNATYAEAAALVDATALYFLRDKARLRAGQTILVNGASGSVGVAAVQLAKHFGATVTGVCSGKNADLVRRLGADAVVDYTGTDFVHRPETYDVIFDVAGVRSFLNCRSALNRGGAYVTTAPSLAIMIEAPWTSLFGARRAAVAFAGLRPAADKRKDLLYTKDLAERSVLVAVIDSEYPLRRVADAHRRVDGGQKQGNVVLTMADED